MQQKLESVTIGAVLTPTRELALRHVRTQRADFQMMGAVELRDTSGNVLETIPPAWSAALAARRRQLRRRWVALWSCCAVLAAYIFWAWYFIAGRR